MSLIYKGKTKDVYSTDHKNHFLLKFKDDVTGTDGVVDPGANTVGMTIEGAGQSGIRMTTYFFKKLIQEDIPTHYIYSDNEKSTMSDKKNDVIVQGLEVISLLRSVERCSLRYDGY